MNSDSEVIEQELDIIRAARVECYGWPVEIDLADAESRRGITRAGEQVKGARY